MIIGVEDYRRALFAATTIGLVAMLIVPFLLGFSVAYISFLPLFVLAALPALALPYVAWRKLHPMRPALEATSLGFLLTLPVLVFTYAAMRVGMPLADGTLSAMDRALGFDWTAFVRLVDQSRIASLFLAIGYSSFSFQLLLLPGLLCIARLPARAYQLMLAYFILCTLSSAIGIFFPSVGAFVTHELDPESLRYVSAKFGFFFLESFHAARSEPDFLLSIANAAGILTFPSVHVGVAVICAWAAWPSRMLRYPFLVLNVIMAISAITHGAHYFVDVLAGILVAAAVVPLVDLSARAARRLQRPRMDPASPAVPA